jgi:hypothetical protein
MMGQSSSMQINKQDVIIIEAIIKSPKRSMTLSGIGLTFTRNGFEVGTSTVFEIFGYFLFQRDGIANYGHNSL